MCAAWAAHSGTALAAHLQSADSTGPATRARGYGRDAVEFRILGPLEVRTDGGAVALGGPKPRAVLAVLLLHANGPSAPSGSRSRCGARRRPRARPRPCRCTSRACARRSATATARDHATAATSCGSSRSELDAERFERLLAEARAELAAGRAQRRRRSSRRRSRSGAAGRSRTSPTSRSRSARSRASRSCGWPRSSSSSRRSSRSAATPRSSAELEALIAEHPLPRAPARAADARALPLRPPGRGAAGLPGRPQRRSSTSSGIEPGDRLRELERAILAQDPALAVSRRGSAGGRGAPAPPAAAAARAGS